MALAAKDTHVASCVEPNSSLCAELQWPARVALLSHGVFGRIADRHGCVACRNKRNDQS